MKKHSYKIAHDCLFDEEDTLLNIPHPQSKLTKYSELKLSDVLKAKNNKQFDKLINIDSNNIVIVDDINKCLNPASERYKRFIIRCVCRKLIKRNKKYFLA